MTHITLLRCFLLLMTMVISGTAAHGQKLKVEAFNIDQTDLTARAMKTSRQDDNGKYCGVIKVHTTLKGVEFTRMVDTVKTATSEYIVYMFQGAQRVEIKAPGFLPLIVRFSDFGIKRIQEKTTYVMRIVPEDNNAGKAYLTFKSLNVKDCKIELTGGDYSETLKPDDNGEVQNLHLPFGTYQYKVTAEGYHDHVGEVTLIDIPVTETFEMQSITGVLKINTQTDAALFIDDERQSSHTLTLPTKRYVVKTEMNGYHRTERINLTSKGLELDMNMLGSLTVTSPRNAKLTIKPVGSALAPISQSYGTSEPIKSLLGNYTVSVWKKGFEMKTKTIEVGPGASIEEGFSLLHSVDNYFFMNYVGTPHAPIGLMLGTVKHFGWYIKGVASSKALELMKKPTSDSDLSSLEGQYYNNLGYIDGDVDYSLFDEEGRNAWNVTAGAMARFFSWCFPFVGGGYGVDECLYYDTNSVAGKETYKRLFTDQEKNGRGVIAEAGVMIKFHALTLIGGYQMHFMQGKTQGELMFGIGFTYNLSSNPLKLK